MAVIRQQPFAPEFTLQMQKRVIIVHRWAGSPDSDWYQWLRAELEKIDVQVEVPNLHVTEDPEIEAWVGKLAQVAGEVDENTFFVGHSIGVQTILRFLERLPAGKKVGGVVTVAGWFSLQNLEEEDVLVAKPWLETQIDFSKVKQHCSKFTSIFSDTDPLVPAENTQWFAERLGAMVITEHNKGHFTADDGVTELPVVLEALQQMMN